MFFNIYRQIWTSCLYFVFAHIFLFIFYVLKYCSYIVILEYVDIFIFSKSFFANLQEERTAQGSNLAVRPPVKSTSGIRQVQPLFLFGPFLRRALGLALKRSHGDRQLAVAQLAEEAVM